jgi:hypothetical protein
MGPIFSRNPWRLTNYNLRRSISQKSQDMKISEDQMSDVYMMQQIHKAVHIYFVKLGGKLYLENFEKDGIKISKQYLFK